MLHVASLKTLERHGGGFFDDTAGIFEFAEVLTEILEILRKYRFILRFLVNLAAANQKNLNLPADF